MLKTWCILFSCLIFLGSKLVLAEPLLIAAEDDWAPYSKLNNQTGQPQGLSPDIVKAVFAAEGVDIAFRTLPFSRCMREAMSGKVLACFNTAITKENHHQYYWHETPLFEEELAIFSLAKESRRNINLNDLEGNRVGIVIGYGYPLEFMNNANITHVRVKSEEQLIEMMTRGRLDYVLMSNIPGHFKIQQLNLENKVVKVGTIKTSGTAGLMVAFSRNHPQGEEMAKRFERGFQKIKKNGIYDKLIKDFKTELNITN